MPILTVKIMIMLQKQLQVNQTLVLREMLMVPVMKCLRVTVIVSFNWTG